MLDTYISPDATFTQNTWSEFANTTVRSCESYHSILNQRFYSRCPNVFNFFDEILKVQSEPHVK